MKCLHVLLLAILVFYATPTHAEELNAGFVQGLWYSKDVFFVDDPVRIYTAIRNNTGSDLTGTVEFYDGENRIERKKISALQGRLVESWADWTPTFGKHTISATLSRIELHAIGSSTREITVTSSLAEDIMFIDYDTDNDGVGNKEDIDDDNDGVSDEDEIDNGTDPLVFDEPSEDDGNDDESIEEEDYKNDDSSSTTLSSNTETRTNQQGLEQYTTDSRAYNMLAGITEQINESKEQLDSYRDERNAEQKTHKDVESSRSSTSTSPSFTEDGFGEVERSQDSSAIGGIFTTLVEGTAALLSALYTFALFIISLYLGHPSFVQFTLLVLIIFIIYKVARRVGRRPQM